MPKYINLIGERFGRLTVVNEAGVDPNGRRLWLCECDCGNTTTVATAPLRYGNTKSCGCMRSENMTRQKYKHGMTGTRVHNEWRHMLDRCGNQHAAAYYRYGGRGIKVCDRWKDFRSFYEDVSVLPNFDNLECTLDRIDNDGDYTPDNVRWADKFSQANNKSTNRYITYRGETHTLAEWARILDIKYGTLGSRLRYGWSIERAFNTSKYANKTASHKK